MKYHEIGEKFEYDGVVLEVVEGTGLWTEDCVNCEVKKSENCHIFHHCSRKYRADKKDVYYKLVKQCKPKENNNMKKQIYYADLTPCDNMDDYKEAAFVPQFVLKDTKEFDTKPPIGVVQLATHLGWCIVAKWYNNGSTRIYGGTEDTIRAGVSILGGCCDSGDCGYAFGEEKISTKFISEEDMSVFYGYTTYN